MQYILIQKTNKEFVKQKLNLGSGWSGIEGWLNYDWGILPLLSKLKFLRRMLIKYGFLDKVYDQKWPNIRLVDIRRRLPLKDNSVKYIYCSHVLEHFERWQAVEILRECERILENDGWLRIVIPDLDKMINSYLKDKDNPSASNEFFHLVWGFHKEQCSGSFFDKLKRKFVRDHEWGYNLKGLLLILQEAGFKKVKEKKFRQGVVPDLKKLDVKNHEWISLYVEAQKS